jgi:hypothetical protein
MKILLLAVLITAVWTLLATVFGRCGGRPVAGNGDSATRQPWFWDALDRNARFIGASSLPSSHPLARFGPSPSQPIA